MKLSGPDMYKMLHMHLVTFCGSESKELLSKRITLGNVLETDSQSLHLETLYLWVLDRA